MDDDSNSSPNTQLRLFRSKTTYSSPLSDAASISAGSSQVEENGPAVRLLSTMSEVGLTQMLAQIPFFISSPAERVEMQALLKAAEILRRKQEHLNIALWKVSAVGDDVVTHTLYNYVDSGKVLSLRERAQKLTNRGKNTPHDLGEDIIQRAIEHLVERGAHAMFCTDADSANSSRTSSDHSLKPHADTAGSAVSSQTCTLLNFVRKKNIAAVQECLKTTLALDFTMTDNELQDTILHLACSPSLSDQETTAILTGVLEHVRRCPEDKINWMGVNRAKNNVFDHAARFQKLNVLWSVVNNVQGVMEACRLPLKIVWADDWEALGTVGRKRFEVAVKDVIKVEPATSMLCRECWKPKPSVEKVKEYVWMDADILFLDPIVGTTPLSQFVWKGDVDAVKACLKATRTIDFTLQDVLGWNLFHCLAEAHHPPSVGKQILEALINRINNHPEEKVDWRQRNSKGNDFITTVAEKQKLSWVWPVLKNNQVSFYCKSVEPVPITCPVQRSDWDQLSPRGQCHFKLEKGFR